VTLALDFEAHGIGKLLVPLVVRRAARNQISEAVSTRTDLLIRRRKTSW
jgi:hypothetical protein